MADITVYTAKVRMEHHDRSNANNVRLELSESANCDRISLFGLSDEQFKVLVELFSDENTVDFSKFEWSGSA